MSTFVTEPSRQVPVLHEADLCVLGGSCTGLFAAIRAARLGTRVVIVEKMNSFGGVATAALVNVWHSVWDTEGGKQIIGGLTEETMKRLETRGGGRRLSKTDVARGFDFNSEELKIELDALAGEAGLTVLFHTVFCAPYVVDGALEGVFVENKSGRGVIRAKAFVDATGDGDLAARLGCETYTAGLLQPATACARFAGWQTLGEWSHNYGAALRAHGAEFGIPEGFAWGGPVPGSDIYMLAATRVRGIAPENADALTRGEMEGRRQVRAIQEILHRMAPENRISLQALPMQIGIRETRHIRCQYQLTGEDVLSGRAFADTIAQGSYRVDIHHHEKPGITLRYLDGTETYCRPGYPEEKGRWRPETEVNPTFYQIPFRSIVPKGCPNLVVAGRMLDADPEAFAAVRVMVNLNQVGEAAGVAAAMAAANGKAIGDQDVAEIRRTLVAGGSYLEPTAAE